MNEELVIFGQYPDRIILVQGNVAINLTQETTLELIRVLRRKIGDIA